MNVIQMQIVENDEERDRKICVAVYTKGKREFAEWIFNHPKYSERAIAGWVKCAHSVIHDLKAWARGGYVGLPHNTEKRKAQRAARNSVQTALESQGNSEEIEISEETESPKQLQENVIDTLEGSIAVANAYRKIFKVSPPPVGVEEVSALIDKLIAKWKAVKATLAARGENHVAQED